MSEKKTNKTLEIHRNDKGQRVLSGKEWLFVVIVGLAGQLIWCVENTWYPNFVYAKIAPDASIISWMVALSALASTFGCFVWGTLGDRLAKRRPQMLIGYAAWGITVILFGLTEYFDHSDMTMLTVLVVAGDCIMSFIGAMANDSGFIAWTTDITEEGNRGKMGAVVAVLPVAGTILGGLLFGKIIEKIDYFKFYIVLGIFLAVMSIGVHFMVKDAPDVVPNKDPKGFWHQVFSVFDFSLLKNNKLMRDVCIIFSVYFIGFQMYFSHLTNFLVYTQGYSTGNAGLVLGLPLIAALPFTFMCSKYLDNGKFYNVMYVSVALTVFGLLLVWIPKTFVTCLGIFLFGTGYMCIYQALMVMLKNCMPKSMHGQSEGIRQIFYVVIPMCIGTPIGSFLIKHFGFAMKNEYGVAGYSANWVVFIAAALWMPLTLIPITKAKKDYLETLNSEENNE
ncbi:MAG: MFS transporter [Oscillospiraceae bacterium]|nr:MFS transporter [Oscillospiraceae bacterium]